MNFVWNQFSNDTADLAQYPCDCWVVGLVSEEIASGGAAGYELDQITGGMLGRLAQTGELPKSGQVLALHEVPGVQAPLLLLVGLKSQCSIDKFVAATRAAASRLAATKATRVLWTLSHHASLVDRQAWALGQSVLALEEADYRFSDFRASDDLPSVDRCVILPVCVADQGQNARAVARAQAAAAGVAMARRLGDTPPNVCTPTYLADAAIELGQRYGLSVDVIETPALEEMGAHALLAVGRGSPEAARLITLHYAGAKADQAPVVLVGKGITFDSGGISIKPSQDMDEMKYDMCGAATVLAVIGAVARLALPLNVVAVVPTCENMPSGHALRPGDIIRSLAGKTIEVLNTDAEGRLILCDALAYSQRFNPALTIDVATLTGSCVVALGSVHSGLFSNDEPLAQALLEAGRESCDTLWRMPLDVQYQEQIKSPFADLSNDGGRKAGSVTAAVFLSAFVQGPWAHLDIAGTAWKSGEKKGATGRPVPMLVQFLENYSRCEPGRAA